MTQLPIDTPLPENIRPGDPVPWVNPQWLDLLQRKVNALMNMRGVGGIRVHKADGGYVIEQLAE
jgi:hypothetical protein